MGHKEPDDHLGTRRFRIWVQGRLDEEFSVGLAGIEQQDVSAGTILSGAVLDQAQVHSTLDLLRNLGIEVLRFEVDPPCAPTSTGLAEHDEASDAAVTYGHPHDSTDRPRVPHRGHDLEKG